MGQRERVRWAIGSRTVGAGGGDACEVSSSFGGAVVRGGSTGSGVGSTGVCTLWVLPFLEVAPPLEMVPPLEEVPPLEVVLPLEMV